MGWLDDFANSTAGRFLDPGGFFKSTPLPVPPDYMALLERQAQIAKQNMQDATQANRPNQYGPGGSVTWSQDPVTGQWTQNTNLSPQSQALFDAQQQLQGGLFGKAGGLLGQIDTGPLDYSGVPGLTDGAAARDQAINAAYSEADKRLAPMFAQKRERLEAQLANQGFDPTAQAAQSARTQLGNQENDAYTSAMNSAIGQGTAAGQALFNQSLAGRQQGVGEVNAKRQFPMDQFTAFLRSAQPQSGNVSMPNFSSRGVVATPDYMGAGQNMWQSAMNNFSAQQAQQQSQQNGILGGLGALLAFL